MFVIDVGLFFLEDAFHGLDLFFLFVDDLDQLFDIGGVVEGCHFYISF